MPYSLRPFPSHDRFRAEYRDTQEFADILEAATDVVRDGKTFRVKGDTYTKEDCRNGLSEYGIDDCYNVYMGDLLECVEYDPMQAKTLLAKMMLDRAIDEIYEMGLWE